MYNITYEIDGAKYNQPCSFALISNANQFAGIRNVYKDVKINDKKFEVLICDLKRKPEILGALLAITTSNVKNANGFKFFRTNNFKISFNRFLKKPWCIDGEKYDKELLEYEIKIEDSIKMLLPKKAIKGNGVIA